MVPGAGSESCRPAAGPTRGRGRHPHTPPGSPAPYALDCWSFCLSFRRLMSEHTPASPETPADSHAKSICLNFGIAGEFSGVCNLRFDDTNPAKEDPEYVAAIQDDVRWLGFEWNELRHASDYFQAYYLAAEKLIEQGKAYVCDLSAEEVRAYRGTLTEPG